MNDYKPTFKPLLVVKILMFPKLFYRFNACLIKIPGEYFVDIDKLILKCIEKGTRLE